jgi:hypothetical protein
MRGVSSKLRVSLEIALALSAVAMASANTTDTTDDFPQQPVSVDYTTSEAGNPFIDGWYADPDTAICKHEIPSIPIAI